jgi:hypothetical protein
MIQIKVRTDQESWLRYLKFHFAHLVGGKKGAPQYGVFPE